MDIDAFESRAPVANGSGSTTLVRRRRRLSGAEVDELVGLYQRVTTHLSAARSGGHDPALVAQLSTLVARARRPSPAPTPLPGETSWPVRHLSFPVTAYRARWWWLASAAGSLAARCPRRLLGGPVARGSRPGSLPPCRPGSSSTRSSAATTRSTPPPRSPPGVDEQCLGRRRGPHLGHPAGYPDRARPDHQRRQRGLDGRFLFAYGKGGLFFGLILPHGLLELTAVFLAAAAGLRLGWCVIDPGPRPAARPWPEEGRAAMTARARPDRGAARVRRDRGVRDPVPLPSWARILIGRSPRRLP